MNLISIILLYAMITPGGAQRDLEAVIVQQMETLHIPGVSAMILKQDRIIWSGTFGHAYVDIAQPVEEGTLFMLASITKTMVATALMQLHEQGLFALHDPVNDYLPFPVVHPLYPGTKITFHMLLTHTSGIKDNWSAMPYYPGDSPIPLDDYLEDYLTPGGSLYDPVLNFTGAEPGTDHVYGNIALALAGYLVEVLSGAALEPYCQEHIFGPLDMGETSFFLANLIAQHIAMPYHWDGAGYEAQGHYGYSDYPRGQVRTSAPQLMRFLHTFIKNLRPPLPPVHGNPSGNTVMGGKSNPDPGAGFMQGPGSPPLNPRLLGKDTAKMMLTPQIPEIHPSQGLVWYRYQGAGRKPWGHWGGDKGVKNAMLYSLEEETGIVLLTNGEASITPIIDALFDYAASY